MPYAIVGSVASSVYGEPRATNDVDLLIQLARADAGRLADLFPPETFYVPPREVVEVELGRDHGGRIKVIALETMGEGRPLSGFRRRGGMVPPAPGP